MLLRSSTHSSPPLPSCLRRSCLMLPTHGKVKIPSSRTALCARLICSPHLTHLQDEVRAWPAARAHFSTRWSLVSPLSLRQWLPSLPAPGLMRVATQTSLVRMLCACEAELKTCSTRSAGKPASVAALPARASAIEFTTQCSGQAPACKECSKVLWLPIQVRLISPPPRRRR